MNLAKKLMTAGMLTLATASICAQQAPAGTYKPDGYKIVTIPTPEDVRFHITGLDNGLDGEIYAATRFGDVWIFKNEKWSKFAEGLHEPTGLLVTPAGDVIVAQKPEFTKLVDTNDDGVADEYQYVAGEWDFHDNYHEFTFGPVLNADGDLIGTLNLSHNNPGAFSLGTMGSAGGYRGFAFKVDKEGEFSPYAWGLRSPAGVGASPTGEVFFTDNQGDWVPTSKMHLLEEGKFYAHPVSLIDVEGYDAKKIVELSKDLDKLARMSEKPVVWIPHVEVANSPGNPEWDTTKGKFGPFEGQIFIGDQTQSNVFRVILDKVNGEYQGAVINFMNKFQSGNIRTAFDEKGQLWIGQTARGWGAKGPKPFGLEKVVWDGTTPFELHEIKLTKTGFVMSFTDELDVKSVNKMNLAAQQWNYHYSGNYGSPKKNLKSVAIKTVKLLDDNKTIALTMPLEADKVVQINFGKLLDKSGRNASVDRVYYTLNQLVK